MEDKITISLSKKQRDLLLKYEPYFANHELFRVISIAVKKGKDYEIYLDQEQLDVLTVQLAELCNNEDDEDILCELDDLYYYLQEFTDTFTVDDEDYYEHSNETGAVYTLKVALINSKKIWRKIAIREGQTLHDLNEIIFTAFDREEEHLYSFFFPYSSVKFNPRKISKASDEYTHPEAQNDSNGQDASMITIGSLNMTQGQVFYYLFDFGDEWWHEITVEKTNGIADDKDYPRIIEHKGKSPDQYGCADDEEDDEY